ncbi:MAG TPA: hypothetical protein VGI65_13325 [Steroidobacteraceae bacterium]|jgi:hypothetical protein
MSTGKSSGEFFVLTPKGAEELHDRHNQLDVTSKHILQLIEEGVASAEAILDRSMFPHKTVVEGLRKLLSNKLVTAGAPGRTARRELRLKFGISPTQTRFALSNFCMDQLGAEERYLVDAVSLCDDVMTLQEVLNSIRAEVDERYPDRLPALFDCVREINETDEGAAPSAAAPRAAKKTVASKPEPKPVRSSAGTPAADPLRLESGISLAQARFTLSEFCLNHFGVRGQELVDAVNHCRDVVGLQKVLTLIRTEVLTHHRERMPALVVSVGEINETAL